MSAELGAQVGLIAPDDETRCLAVAGRRARHRSGAVAQRRGRAGHAPQLRCLDAGAAGRAAAQPGQCTRWPTSSPRRCRWPTSARARAPSSTTCAPRPRVLRGPARSQPWRANAGGAGEPARARGGEREGMLRALKRRAPRSCRAPAARARAMAPRCPEDSTMIASMARNFKGRMGPDSAQVFLGSPYTVARLGAARAHHRSARGAVGGEIGVPALHTERAWRVRRADVDTDALAPGHGMKHGLEVIAQHCLEALRPEFALEVRAGDVIVAGRTSASARRANRPPRAGAAGHRGSDRAIYGGHVLPQCLQRRAAVAHLRRRRGDRRWRAIKFDARQGVVHCVGDAQGRDLQGRGPVFDCEPIPPFLLERVQAGGLLPQLKRRFQAPR